MVRVDQDEFYSIEEYLSRKNSEKTKKDYRRCMNNWLKYLGIQPERFDIEDYLKNSTRKKIETDLYDFLKLRFGSHSSQDVNVHLSAINRYLRINGFILNLMLSEDIRNMIGSLESDDPSRLPTPDELRQIFVHLDNVGTPFFHFLLSTGMRVNEATSLELDDVDWDFQYPKTNEDTGETEYHRVVRVKIRKMTTKKKYGRYAFLTDDAKEYLDAWVRKGREDFLHRAPKYTNLEKKPRPKSLARKPKHSTKLFPFSSEKARYDFRKAVKKAGLGKKSDNGLHDLRVHGFRSIFLTKMSPRGEEFANIIAGHKINPLDSRYKKHYEDKELPEWFVENMDALNISNLGRKVQAGIKSRDKNIKRLHDEVEKLQTRGFTDKDKDVIEEIVKTKFKEVFLGFNKMTSSEIAKETEKLMRQARDDD